jgi:hypothetical protein
MIVRLKVSYSFLFPPPERIMMIPASAGFYDQFFQTKGTAIQYWQVTSLNALDALDQKN